MCSSCLKMPRGYMAIAVRDQGQQSLVLKLPVNFTYPEQYRLNVSTLQENTGLKQGLFTADVLAPDNIKLVAEVGIDEFANFVAAFAQHGNVRPFLFVELAYG